jgi:hypothetical protein
MSVSSAIDEDMTQRHRAPTRTRTARIAPDLIEIATRRAGELTAQTGKIHTASRVLTEWCRAGADQQDRTT